MSLGRTFKLNSGHAIPAIGLGTWLSQPHEVENAVEIALKAGYRHIDGASIYGNEAEVGRGWKKSGVPRSEIFLTSKLWNTHQHPDHVEEALDQTLKDLQTDYVDLYLIHWPVSFAYSSTAKIPVDPTTFRVPLVDIPIADTWKALEAQVAKGKIRSIGISNFNVQKTKELLAVAKIPPAVNQIEAHPWLQQPDLTNFLKDNNILPAAYSPLGNNIYGLPKVVDDPAVVEIAQRLKKDPAQVLISWAVQRGTAVLPKSVTASRIQSNLQDFVLSDEDFQTLNKEDRHQRYNLPARWGVDVFGDADPEVLAKAVREFEDKNRADAAVKN